MKNVIVSKNTTLAAFLALASSTLLAACGGMAGSNMDMNDMNNDNPQTATYSLEGTWDLSTSNQREIGALEWGINSIRLTIDDAVFELETPSANFVMATLKQRQGPERQAGLTHMGSLDLGVIPFDFGGMWKGTTPEYPNHQCAANISEDSIRASCGRKQGSGAEEFSLKVDKVDAKPSVFGKLGGIWQTTVNGKGCTVSLTGSHIEVSCARSNGGTQTLLEAEVGKDSVSGTLGSSEFSAQKRPVAINAPAIGIR